MTNLPDVCDVELIECQAALRDARHEVEGLWFRKDGVGWLLVGIVFGVVLMLVVNDWLHGQHGRSV